MKSIYCILLWLIPVLLNAQPGKEATHWQFGHSLSLDFSSGTPVPGSSAIHTTEGSASISDDQTGQLLFYTDGDTVWNHNNQVLPHGTGLIGGDGTSAQAALILPKPGAAGIYYIITADQGGYGTSANKGVFYSVVDMTLSGGLGDIVVKNQLLTSPPTVEKVTAVQHCNGKDYWIITHSFLSNRFNSYLLSSNGIDPTPVISEVGLVEQNTGGNFNETIGCMKASPSGNKLAYCISYYFPTIQICNFDNASGQVSDPILISYNGNPSPYGLSFSPDSRKLYVSEIYDQQILQYDLSSSDSSLIAASETPVARQRPFSGMQIANDGKIYVISGPSCLAVIDQPNAAGLNCQFQDSAIVFTNGQCEIGLPEFVDAPKNESEEKKSFSVPNIVTPNNDGINDLIDFGSYPFAAFHIEIFNRWGNRIFESGDRACNWTPTCHDGTYYYIAQYFLGCDDKQGKSLKGFIQVIR